MKFKIFYHNIFQKHIVPQGHPEKAERITTINNLISNKFSSFIHEIEKRETFKHISKIHSGNYLETIYSLKPVNGLIQLDEDTFFSENTLKAAEYAVSGLLHSIDFVMKEKNNRSFVCSRPPGHHAEPDKAMGFCIFSNAAIGAKYALDKYKLKKVAVLDFDVHHGNGTQSFFEKDQKNLIFASSHEMPLFPGTGSKSEVGCGNIINEPLKSKTTGKDFLKVWINNILPKVKELKPELIILSAGFDAHKDDPLSSVQLSSKDYKYLTDEIVDFANNYCNGRIVSILEGGYNIKALKETVELHIKSLIKS